jgi:virulence factor Mce-like protein
MESRSRKLDALLGAIVLGVIGAFVWLSLAVGGGAPRDAERYVLLFDSALGLHEDNAVAIAGVQIGVVDSIGIAGRQARVVVAIDPSVQLHENAKAAVRSKTLLGEKYVDLDPGESPAELIAPGETLAQNVPTVEIDSVIRSVSQLVASLNVITPPLETAVTRVDTMLQNADQEKLGDELTRTLADAGALIRETNKIVATSGKDFREILKMTRERGPTVFDQLESATGRMDRVLAVFDDERLKSGASKIGPTLDTVDAAAQDLRVAMADFKRASSQLEGLLTKVDKNLTRLDDINERNIREFFQVQGVRVNLIPDANVTRRVRNLKNEATPLPE